MALPPFDAGAVHETEAEALPAVAVTTVGAPGTVAGGGGATGVTLLEGADAALAPIALVATREAEEGAPVASPVTAADVAVTVVLPPAGLEGPALFPYTTLFRSAGAVQETEAEALPAVAVTVVGAPGTVAGGGGATGVTLLEAAEAALEPTELV